MTGLRGCYLGEDKSVVVSSPWFWDGVLHGVEEQYRHYLGNGATWCGMSEKKEPHSSITVQIEWIPICEKIKSTITYVIKKIGK